MTARTLLIALRRSDFGLNNGIPFIGDEIQLHIQVEASNPCHGWRARHLAKVMC